MRGHRVFRRLVKTNQVNDAPEAIDVLLSESVWAKDGKGREQMTISCHDTDYIPKVKNAGKMQNKNDQKVQIMHNGLLVVAGGYHGEWMSKIITALKGHHEPQEEKVFYELLRHIGDNATMIELGSFWSYYSLWFNKEKKNARNICCEPDSTNLEIGKLNAGLNNARNLEFCEVASGAEDGHIELPMDSDAQVVKKVPVRSVDSLVKQYRIKKLDLLHMDIQGFELDALHGAIKTITSKKLRFIIVSTHHYFFSKDPLTHQKCIDFIKENGGHIIASHTVLESFSGDGLIAASFDNRDKNLAVEVSVNHTDNSLFRSYEKDVALLMQAYNTQIGAAVSNG
jgi:FkbM family methyltransferase